MLRMQPRWGGATQECLNRMANVLNRVFLKNEKVLAPTVGGGSTDSAVQLEAVSAKVKKFSKYAEGMSKVCIAAIGSTSGYSVGAQIAAFNILNK